MVHPVQLFPDSRSSDRNVGSLIVNTHICPVCGASYEGDPCWTCLTREEDVKQEFQIFLWVGLAGWLGIGLATIAVYPPLQTNLLTQWPAPLGLALLFIPMFACMAVSYEFDQYARPIRIVLLFAGSGLVLGAAFYLLNGALDQHPALEVDSLVISKFGDPASRFDYPYYTLHVSLLWKGEQIEQEVEVSHEIFREIELGDSVTLTVHRGAFLTPWIDDGTWASGDYHAIRLKSR